MSEKITITFPDGNKKEVDKGISGLDLASHISKFCSRAKPTPNIVIGIFFSLNNLFIRQKPALAPYS